MRGSPRMFCLSVILPSCCAAAGVAAIVAWLQVGPLVPVEARVPGLDGAPSLESLSADVVRPAPGEPLFGPGKAGESPGVWPWFRGPHRDGIVPSAAIARRWRQGRPELLWQTPVAEGYAAPAVAQGRVFFLDYDVQRKADVMRCLSLDDGREIWRNSYAVDVSPNHGITRTVPAVVGDLVISFGPKYHVVAWEAATGRARWIIDLVADHGATVPDWYAGQCPLYDDKLDQLILAPGGPSLLLAVDPRTGAVRWKSENPQRWLSTHTSVVITEIEGRRSYVYSASGGVALVAADSGELLCQTNAWRVPTAACASPVPLGDGRVFCSGGYDSGAMMLRFGRQGERYVCETLFQLKPRQFSSEQQTPVFFQGHLFGVRQFDKRLVCLDADGNERWNSGREKFGAAPYLIADGLLLALNDRGRLTLTPADPAGPYQPLAQAELFEDGVDAWGPMALAGDRLIVRDFTRMQCVRIGGE